MTWISCGCMLQQLSVCSASSGLDATHKLWSAVLRSLVSTVLLRTSLSTGGAIKSGACCGLGFFPCFFLIKQEFKGSVDRPRQEAASFLASCVLAKPWFCNDWKASLHLLFKGTVICQEGFCFFRLLPWYLSMGHHTGPLLMQLYNV